MSVVKIKNKELLDQLQAKITLQMGVKPTQQDLLDICIRLGLENVDKITQKLQATPLLDAEKVARIIQMRESAKEAPYLTEPSKISQDDRDVYLS